MIMSTEHKFALATGLFVTGLGKLVFFGGLAEVGLVATGLLILAITFVSMYVESKGR
jgi:hypothetical protein